MVLDSPVLPAYKDHVVFAALVITVGTVFLVKPTADVGRLRVPVLSQLQLRIVFCVIVLAFLLSFANYRLLDPGFFAPYKRQVFGAMLGVTLLFIHLYEPQLAALGKKGGVARGDSAA
jgi:hypothetical protein